MHLDSRPRTSCGANEFRLHDAYGMQNERRLQLRRDVSSIETSQTQPGKRTNLSLGHTTRRERNVNLRVVREAMFRARQFENSHHRP
jgi:hypothetical protein